MQTVKDMTDAGDFGTFGRYEEPPVAQMTPKMKDAYDFTMQLRGMVPGPHKIWLANPKLSKVIVPVGEYYQQQSTLSKAEIEIVTTLTMSRWKAAYSTYEHEKIGETIGHLPADNMDKIIAGLTVTFDDNRQQIIYELAFALLQARIVSMGLYKRAKEALGDAGILDVAVLVGWNTMASMTLYAFDVPSDATGLEQ